MFDKTSRSRTLFFVCPHCGAGFTCCFGGGKSLRAKRGHENTCQTCGRRMVWDGARWGGHGAPVRRPLASDHR